MLVSGGWARDELKESSFALVQWKARVRDGELARGRVTATNEDRTEERWVLVEEYVPREYRDELRDGKVSSSAFSPPVYQRLIVLILQKKPVNKGASFLRSVRRKPKEPVVRLNASQITHSHLPPPVVAVPYHSTARHQVDESVFTADGRAGDTKIMSLSNVSLNAAKPDYAPSAVSTTGAAAGHPESVAEDGEDGEGETAIQALERCEPPVVTRPQVKAGNGVGVGTMSSQVHESAFHGAGVPAVRQGGVGYTMPTAAKSFLARISSRKVKPVGISPYGNDMPGPPAQASPTDSMDSYGPPDTPDVPNEMDSGSTVRRRYKRASIYQ